MKYLIATIAVLTWVSCAAPIAEEPSVGEQQVDKMTEEVKVETAKEEEAPADTSAEEAPAEE